MIATIAAEASDHALMIAAAILWIEAGRLQWSRITRQTSADAFASFHAERQGELMAWIFKAAFILAWPALIRGGRLLERAQQLKERKDAFEYVERARQQFEADAEAPEDRSGERDHRFRLIATIGSNASRPVRDGVIDSAG